MLTQFKRIKGLGIFQDFGWPADLPPFARFNLVFGWNGTGKTTLSRLFRAMETRAFPAAEMVELEVLGKRLTWDDSVLPNLPPVRVFTREYVDDTVYAGDGKFAKIVIVAKEAADKKKKADSAKKKISDLDKAFVAATNDARKADKKVSDFLSVEAGRISKAMLELGQAGYKSFNKRSLSSALDKLGSSKVSVLEEQMNDWKEVLRTGVPPQYPTVEEVNVNVAAVAQRIAQLIQRKVATSALSSLQDDEVLSRWVNNGLLLHQQRNTEVCLYCGNMVSPTRTVELEAHFSKALHELNDAVDHELKDLDTLEATLKANVEQLPDSADILPAARKKYVIAKKSYQQACSAVEKWIANARKALQGKRNSPFTASSFGYGKVDIPANPPTSDINKALAAHNKPAEDFAATQDNARDALERAEVAARQRAYADLTQAAAISKVHQEKAHKTLVTAQAELADIEREISEHRRPGEEVTSELHAYLGRSELTLAIEADGYSLQRSGKPALASTLSEGEKTALALLFFLKTLDDKDFKGKSGLVVIDDPVSSLDSNALFSAMAFIRERLDNPEAASQVFLLTHNFSLFREAKKWLDRRREKGDAQFFMLQAAMSESGRTASLVQLDPLLKDYDSEYHYLFYCIQSAIDNAKDWVACYPLPNIARRLVESFLAFRVPGRGDFVSKLSQAAKDFPTKTKRSYISFLQFLGWF